MQWRPISGLIKEELMGFSFDNKVELRFRKLCSHYDHKASKPPGSKLLVSSCLAMCSTINMLP